MNAQKQLFQLALNISEPIYIESIAFDQEIGELRINLDFTCGAKFACPICEKNGCSVHDTTEKTWRHLNFFQYKCFLHLRTPKIICEQCGLHLFVPSWAQAESGFTMLFEALIITFAKAMPVSAIADIVDEHDTRLWRIVREYTDEAYSKKDLKNVTKIGIDETSSRKGHKYISVVADMDKSEVIYVTAGKDESVIPQFNAELEKHNGSADNIQEISMDMSPAFIAGARKHLPNANVTFDKFHVVKLLNEAIDAVRREEARNNPLLKGTRYIWLKNPENLTVAQSLSLKDLSNANKKLAKAYQMKITLQDIYRTFPDRASAEVAIKKWLSWAVRSRLPAIKHFAQTLKSHFAGVLRYFDSRLTAGISEGINSRIQEIKRRAKGFRNIQNFIALIYLVCGNLPLPAKDSTHSK